MGTVVVCACEEVGLGQGEANRTALVEFHKFDDLAPGGAREMGEFAVV